MTRWSTTAQNPDRTLAADRGAAGRDPLDFIEPDWKSLWTPDHSKLHLSLYGRWTIESECSNVWDEKTAELERELTQDEVLQIFHDTIAWYMDGGPQDDLVDLT